MFKLPSENAAGQVPAIRVLGAGYAEHDTSALLPPRVELNDALPDLDAHRAVKGPATPRPAHERLRAGIEVHALSCRDEEELAALVRGAICVRPEESVVHAARGSSGVILPRPPSSSTRWGRTFWSGHHSHISGARTIWPLKKPCRYSVPHFGQLYRTEKLHWDVLPVGEAVEQLPWSCLLGEVEVSVLQGAILEALLSL